MTTTSLSSDPRWRHVPRLAGAATALLGLLVIIAWHAHWPAFIRLRPNLAPIPYNTALGLLLCGLGLLWLTLLRPAAARWLGPLAAILGLLTLGEYLTGNNLGLDQLFFKSSGQPDEVFPGRMSPLAAGCFTLIGAALAVAGGIKSSQRRLTFTGVLACIATVIALMVLFGYAAGIDTAHGWRGYPRMAVLSAGAFLCLGGGLLLWAAQQGKGENTSLVRWLPTTASLTMMAMIAFLSIVTSHQMDEAARQHRQTHQLLQARDNLSEDERHQLEDSSRLETGIQSNIRQLRFGRLLVAGILLTALWLANHELNRRRHAEAQNLKLIGELQASLAEVKTLSGLIPICGWCKSIRSDTGYWQSVEQYVRTHTGATFTHGLCPTCSDKMKAEIFTSNPETPPGEA